MKLEEVDDGDNIPSDSEHNGTVDENGEGDANDDDDDDAMDFTTSSAAPTSLFEVRATLLRISLVHPPIHSLTCSPSQSTRSLTDHSLTAHSPLTHAVFSHTHTHAHPFTHLLRQRRCSMSKHLCAFPQTLTQSVHSLAPSINHFRHLTHTRVFSLLVQVCSLKCA